MTVRSLAEAVVEIAAKLALGDPRIAANPEASAKEIIVARNPFVRFDEIERDVVERLGALVEANDAQAVDLAEATLRNAVLGPELLTQGVSVDGLFELLIPPPSGVRRRTVAAYDSLIRACCWRIMDNTSVIWNRLTSPTASWRPRWRQLYSGGPIRTLASIQLETGPYIVAGGENGTVMLDQFTGTGAQVDRSSTTPATAVATGFAPDPTAIMGDSTGEVRVVPLPTSTPETPGTSIRQSAEYEIRAVAVTHQGSDSVLCVAGFDGISVWLGHVAADQDHESRPPTSALAVVRENNRPILVSGGPDAVLRSYELPPGQNGPWEFSFPGEIQALAAVDLQSRAHVLVGGAGGALVLYDLRSGETTELVGHSEPVREVAVFDETEGPIAVSLGGSIRMWDLAKGEQIAPSLGSAHAITTVRLDDRQFLLAGMDDGVYVTEVTKLVKPGEPLEHAGFSTDTAIGEDRLGIADDVETLAALMLAKDVDPPLAVGLFGDWGTGKSFFMNTLNKRIAKLAADAKAAGESSFCGNVCQVEFNAWHYADANLWASLASAIFDELAADETTLKELPSVNEVREELQQKQSKAEQKLRQATEDLAALDAQLKAGDLNAKDVTRALQQAGVPEEVAARLGAQDAATELDGITGRIRYLLTHAQWSVRALIMASIGLLLAGPALLALAPAEWHLAPIISAIGATLVAVNPHLKRAGNALKVAEDVVRQADETRREPLKQLILKYEDEHRGFTAQIEELDRAHSIRSFATQRLATADYRKHEGVVSLIRRDLKELSRRIAKRVDIERIVLYIDDLDRCPPKRVVEVLQAVHLLLAFPLFVVIVGVDSRWLLRSLHDQYADLMESAETPQSYLEKIFQISLCLRPMTQRGYADLVTTDLLPALVDTEPAKGIEATPPPSAQREQQPPVTQPAETAHQQASPQRQATTPAESRDTPTRRQQLVAQALRLNHDERQLIVDAHPLIGTPRTAKRLVNVYRLLRASLPPHERERLVAGDFRPVVILLAILVGSPLQGTRLLEELTSREGQASEQPFLELLDSFPAGEGRSLANAVRHISTATDIPADTASYARWAPRVARYSFRTGHVFSE